ncbi:hypothetical protein Syun_002877 [Stephania yunnanensis]|uniref:Pentatricopeptide repeat-containing protein n=1 Tax=Stephania yunnanensis TaxID=152371 RepID=A0AAP0L164_9MAGN
MTLHRLLLRSLLRRPNPVAAVGAPISARTFAFSSAEEAAAERRRRKRRLRIEPPSTPSAATPPPPAPSRPQRPRLPDSTSALVGPRLNLHNRVQSLIRAADLDAASAIARHAVFSNTRPTVFTCNAITASMYRARRYDDAVAHFHFFFNQSNIVPNVVSYNVLINTHCDAGRVDVALDVYRHIIQNAPFSPSPVTYRHLTKGLIDADRITDAIDLLREMLNKGHGADSLVYNNLISGFLNLGNVERANELFDELRERCLVYDGVVNATFMEWHFKRGEEKEAMDSYKGLLDRQFKMTPATCNVLLEVLIRNGKVAEANALFEHMLDTHTPPNFHALNSDTFNIMVNECFRLGKNSEALAVFKRVGTKQGSKPFAMDAGGYNNIMGKYIDLDMIEEAEKLFAEMCSKSVTQDMNTYRMFIDVYLAKEQIDDVLNMFNKMVFDANVKGSAAFYNKVFGGLVSKGRVLGAADALMKMGEKEMKPDPISYEIVISGLCYEGGLDNARDLLIQMVRYNIALTPNLRSYVNDAFGRAGRIEEIERLLGRPFDYAARGPPPAMARAM